MHYHWNRNLLYHEMLLAIQVAPEKENRYYSDLSEKPFDSPEIPVSMLASPDHSKTPSDKAPEC